MNLLIQNGSTIYAPSVEEGVTWELERKGTPGKLSFNVVKAGNLNIQEGNAVKMSYANKNLFYGFIFAKKRSKENSIQVTAYDQLRYFKNKDTYQYKNKTAGALLKMIAADFRLKTGDIADTG